MCLPRRLVGPWVFALMCLGCLARQTLAKTPRVLEPGWTLELIAEAPQLVTPIAVTVDSHGQILVIESHTHQRPEPYTGPTTDRILRVADTDGDGRADRMEPFFEGTAQTMSLLTSADGWIIVATRREILRIRDTDGDGRAETQEKLIQLETAGDYPHNGLAGLTWTPQGELLFGLGENLGASYRVVGSDQRAVAGGGEGGSVYVCQPDGTRVRRLATGFWNPFGTCFDAHGRLYVVDNDPDASPPCRLLHVVEGGDYGYQFRYGRSGRHALQAWNGELPGTLPMAAGTGEAPCQVLPYQGRLWVTSWGDHRLEAFELQSHGASVEGSRQIVVQGDDTFRPVGLAVTPQGDLIFSDWVDRSYPVHGQGRLWRLRGQSSTRQFEIPTPSAAEHLARQLVTKPAREYLTSDDPFLRHATVTGLSRDEQFTQRGWSELATAHERLAWLEVQRWAAPERLSNVLRQALADADRSVVIYALRIVAETRHTESAATVESLVRTRADDAELARVALSTWTWLVQGESATDPTPLWHRLASYLDAPDTPTSLRVLALQWLPLDHPALTAGVLRQAIDSQDAQLQREALDILIVRQGPEDAESLTAVARRAELPSGLRADAISGLAAYREARRGVLEEFARDPDPVLQREAQRSLGTESSVTAAAPPVDDLQAWHDYLAGEGDADAGRRIFFRATGARCSQCHGYRGRGSSWGPDLGTIHRRATEEFLLQAILTPHKDVGPRYASTTWILEDGRTLTGLVTGGPGEEGVESLVTGDGQIVSVPSAQIAERHPLVTSIMPADLHKTLSREEFRDLLAFLLRRDRAH